MSKFQKIYEDFKENLIEEKVNVKDVLKAFEKEIDEDQAKEVLDLMKYPGSPSKASDNLEKIDKLIDGYGVEAINSEDYYTDYFTDAMAVYVNMGDTYASTVLFDTDEREFLLTTVGDWQKQKEKDGIKFK